MLKVFLVLAFSKVGPAGPKLGLKIYTLPMQACMYGGVAIGTQVLVDGALGSINKHQLAVT